MKSGWNLLVALAAVLCYASVLTGPFLWDDRVLILENSYIKGVQPAWAPFMTDFARLALAEWEISPFYRPLTLLSFRLDALVWGFSPFGFHLTNLLAHLGCSLAVMHLGNRLFDSPRAGLAAGLLFAVHPVHTESVSWISGRTDVLACLFGLGALLLALRGTTASALGSALALALALLAKESTVVIPVLSAAALALRRTPRGVAFRVLGLQFLALGAVLALRHQALDGLVPTLDLAEGLGNRILLAPRFFLEYLGLLAMPFWLSIERHLALQAVSPLSMAAGWVVALTWAGLLAWTARRAPAVCFSLAWIPLALIPVLNLVPLPQPLAERFLYLPSVGFCLLLAALLADRHVRILALIVLVWAAATVARNQVWNDEGRFWQAAVAARPESQAARLALGIHHLENGRLDQAESHLLESIRLAPRTAAGYHYLAQLRLAQRSLAGAEQAYRDGMAAGARPEELLHRQFGNLAESTGDLPTALERYLAGPPSAALEYNAGVVLGRLQRWDEAALHFERALELDPFRHQARHNLLVALVESGDQARTRGDLAGARKRYRYVLQTGHQFPEVQARAAQGLAEISP